MCSQPEESERDDASPSLAADRLCLHLKGKKDMKSL